jgi:hypothetical protein
LQGQIIEAVEQHFPEKQLKGIAEEIGCHQSTVTRTVQDFMAPEGKDGEPREEQPINGPAIDFDFNPSEMTGDVESYVEGYSDGFEAGFDAALEWVEEHTSIPRGTFEDRTKDRDS